jgi:hypothetical protein
MLGYTYKFGDAEELDVGLRYVYLAKRSFGCTAYQVLKDPYRNIQKLQVETGSLLS